MSSSQRKKRKSNQKTTTTAAAMNQNNNSHGGSNDTSVILRELEQLLRPLVANNDDISITNDEEAMAAFQQHVGPYPAVIDAAASHVTFNCREEVFFSNSTTYDRSFGPYDDPFFHCLKGPKPDLHVWMGLFLGREREEQSRQLCEAESKLPCYSQMKDAFSSNGEIRKLPMATLTRNVLVYLATESEKMSTRAELLCFCAIYGLPHAMRHVLRLNYGLLSDDVDDENLSIDSALRIPTKLDKYDPFQMTRPIGMPAVGIAAVLGHHHVVRYAVESLRADWQAQLVVYLPDGSPRTIEPIGEKALAWVIGSKQIEMIQHLVDCGVRFCWLSTEKFKTIFSLLFHIDGAGDEYGPRWHGVDYNPEEVLMSLPSMSDVRRYRAKNCYKEKQKVVRALIKAGMPRELFIPSMDVSIEQNLMEEAKARGLEEPDRAMCMEAERALPRSEKKARDFICGACAAYNSVTKRDEQKTTVEFYQHLLDLWKEQTVCQSLFQPWWERRDSFDE